jgi:hypothetical protein
MIYETHEDLMKSIKQYGEQKEREGYKVGLYKSSDVFFVAYCFDANRKFADRKEFQLMQKETK